jgi:hypothetical protein
LDIKLKLENKRVIVSFGERDGVYIGHVLIAVNGQQLNYDQLPDGTNVFEVIRFIQLSFFVRAFFLYHSFFFCQYELNVM